MLSSEQMMTNLITTHVYNYNSSKSDKLNLQFYYIQYS